MAGTPCAIGHTMLPRFLPHLATSAFPRWNPPAASAHTDCPKMNCERSILGLVRQEYLDAHRDHFLCMERPVGKSPIPRVLSVEQLRHAVEVAEPPYNCALVLTLVDPGVRIGELEGCIDPPPIFVPAFMLVPQALGRVLLALRPGVRAVCSPANCGA